MLFPHKEYNLNDLQVRLGENDLRSKSEPLKHLDKEIEKVIIHERFDNRSKEFDIALLKMRSPSIEYQVTFSKLVTYLNDNLSATHNSNLSPKLR